MTPSLTRLDGGSATIGEPPLLARLQRVVAQLAAGRRYLGVVRWSHLAVERMQVEREIGLWIAQTVHRGGSGSRSNEVTSKRGGSSAPLPPGVTKQRAARFRQLAAIPDSTFREYLAHITTSGLLPSANGALAFAGSGGRSTSGRCQAVSPSACNAVLRVLGAIDTLVGPQLMPAKRTVPALAFDAEHLRGRVVVIECLQPARWLPLLGRLVELREISDLIVFLQRPLGQRWQHHLRGWVLVSPAGFPTNAALAYHGERTAAFRTVMSELGIVMTIAP